MPLREQEKQEVIAQALSTPEGRTALAQAMCSPITMALNSINFGKKLLFEVEKVYEVKK